MNYRGNDLQKVQAAALDVFRKFVSICDKYRLDYFVHWGTALGAVRHQGFIPWDDDIDVGMLRQDYERFLAVAPGEAGEAYVLSSAFIQNNCFGLYTMMSQAGTLHITEQESLWGYHHGIRIDIFPFDEVPQDPRKRRRQIRRVRFFNLLYTMKNLAHPYLPGHSLKMKLVRGMALLGHYLLIPVPVGWLLQRAHAEAVRYRGTGGFYTLLYDLHAEQWLLSYEDIYPLQEGIFEGMPVRLLHHNHQALTAAYGDYMVLPQESERVNHYSGRLKFHEKDH